MNRNKTTFLTTAVAALLLAGLAPRCDAQLLNLATRHNAGVGDSAIINEFVIQGPAPKDMMVRGIAPSLVAFGLFGALTDPLLELRNQSGGLLTSNDNWMDSPTAIQESGLAPSHPLESAMRLSLPPGMYSVELRGVNGATGTAVNELYDFAPSASTLAAMGSRGFVGFEPMVTGFIVGSSPTSVLVLSLGPSLGAGVPKALSNPNVELRDQNATIIATNDNWKSDQQQAIEDTGLAPSNDLESAFVVQLGQGAYTAIVRGGGFFDSGIGWVQIYALPYTGEKLAPLPTVGSANPPPPPPVQANLAFFSPGWADKILVSNTTGTQTDSPVLSPTDTLYVDFGISNIGQGSTNGSFNVEVSVDDIPVANLLKPALGAFFFTTNLDLPIGSLPAGSHTIRIRLDSANAIAESNEGDNEYTKNIVISAPGTATPAGINVPIDTGTVGTTSIAMTFPQVTSAGSTTVTGIEPNPATPIPAVYELAGADLAFEIATTATYTGPITIAFQVPSLDAATFSQLRVLHYENGGWVDVTVPTPAPDPHPGIQTIYAQVSSLSPFVLAKAIYSAAVQSPINADKTSVFGVKRGVVPLKFTLSSRGSATCTLPPATISLTRTAGAAPGSVNESTYSMAADNGSNFRSDDCQYIYNLNSGGLGAGTYRADLKINGSTVGSATFQLK